ncbi:hypothetical protein ABIE12_002513 [Serratia sp. 509]
MEYLVILLAALCLFSFNKHAKVIDSKKIGVPHKKHRRRSRHRLVMIY